MAFSPAYSKYVRSLGTAPWANESGGDTLWNNFDPVKAQAAGLSPMEVYGAYQNAKGAFSQGGGGFPYQDKEMGTGGTGNLDHRYQAWLKSQPADVQNQINQTWLSTHPDRSFASGITGAFLPALAVAAAPFAIGALTGASAGEAAGAGAAGGAAADAGAMDAAITGMSVPGAGLGSGLGTAGATGAAVGTEAAATGAADAGAMDAAITGMSVPGAGLGEGLGTGATVSGGLINGAMGPNAASAPSDSFLGASDTPTAAMTPAAAAAPTGNSVAAQMGNALSAGDVGAAESAFNGMSVPGAGLGGGLGTGATFVAGITGDAETGGPLSDFLNWAHNNKELATGLVTTLGGLLKGIGDAQSAQDLADYQLKLKEALQQWQRQFVQSGSYWDAKIGFRAPAKTRALTRPGGAQVYRPSGLIADAMALGQRPQS